MLDIEGGSFDELKHCFGSEDYKINDYIKIHIPTIMEIMDFGEDSYFALISILTRKPYDIALDLWEHNVDYQDITDYDLFLDSITFVPKEASSIIFGELNFKDFKKYKNNETGFKYLVNLKEPDIIIDEAIYRYMVTYLRYCHFISEKVEYDVGNKTAKRFLIDRLKRKRKKYQRDLELGRIKKHSVLSDLIRFCVNNEQFKYDYESVLNLKINLLYESYYTIQHLENRDNLFNGIYSATVDVSKLKERDELKPIVDLHVWCSPFFYYTEVILNGKL